MSCINDQNTNCNHQWKADGIWDGKTPDGQPTGGKMYKCINCEEKAFTRQEISEKGGEIIDENLPGVTNNSEA